MLFQDFFSFRFLLFFLNLEKLAFSDHENFKDLTTDSWFHRNEL